MLRCVALAAGLLIAGCSSDDSVSNEKVGDIRSDQVWKDGTKLTGVIRIFEGATVEIAPGARISCTESAQILVGGTLRVTSPGKHAAITCPRWQGIVAAQNGRLLIEGLDIENADTGIETTRGAGTVEITDAKILTTTRPFRVGPESKVTATRVTVTTPTTLPDFETSVTHVSGTFVAKYLDYEANTNEGIMVLKGGEADIEDSTLKAKNGAGDLVSSYGGKALRVRYTTMTGAHCGPHIAESTDEEKLPTEMFELDHVTSEGNIYGVTIYAASATGPLVIKDSNFQGSHSWLDLQGPHGPITFQNIFTTGEATIVNTDVPTFQKAPSRIENAKPR